MKAAIYRLCCAALPLFLLPLDAQAQRRSCITDAEIEAEIGPQVRSGALLVDASRIDNGRPLCTGGTIAQRIHRMREEVHPEERAARLDRRDRVRADVARIARDEEEARGRLREAERLEQLARIAEAQRAIAAAEADTSEAALRDARSRRALATLRPVERRDAQVLVEDNRALDTQLEQVVLQDSEYWLANRYAPGSMHDSRFLSVDRTGAGYDAIGFFHYQEGSEGWVIVRYHRGQLTCLEFHNQPGTCRELGNSLSRQNLLAAGQELFWMFLPKLLKF